MNPRPPPPIRPARPVTPWMPHCAFGGRFVACVSAKPYCPLIPYVYPAAEEIAWSQRGTFAVGLCRMRLCPKM